MKKHLMLGLCAALQALYPVCRAEGVALASQAQFDQAVRDVGDQLAAGRTILRASGPDWLGRHVFGYFSPEDIVPGTGLRLKEIGKRVHEKFRADRGPIALEGIKKRYSNPLVPETTSALCEINASERNSPGSVSVDCRRRRHPDLMDTEEILDLLVPDSAAMDEGKIRLRYLDHSGPFGWDFFGSYLIVNPATFAIEGIEIWKDDVYFGPRGRRIIYELRASRDKLSRLPIETRP